VLTGCTGSLKPNRSIFESARVGIAKRCRDASGAQRASLAVVPTRLPGLWAAFAARQAQRCPALRAAPGGDRVAARGSRRLTGVHPVPLDLHKGGERRTAPPEIEHPAPGENRVVYARYAHLGSLSVQEGWQVQRGQKIGTIGEYAPNNYHLHFDISPTMILKTTPNHWPGDNLAAVQKDYVDPLAFIKQRHVVR